MKRYITYIIAILSLAYVASCTKTDDIANPNDSGRMTLLLQSSIMTRSADDTEGLNEDVVSSVDCYFYPANSSADANAVWHCKVTPTPVSESSGSYEIENIDMKSGDIAKVFPNGSTTAKVYIIANYPGNDLPTAEANNLSTGYGSSIATLKAKIIQQTWGGNNPSFVMDSDGTATVKKDGSAVSNGTTPIYLTRAAAKIELTITSVKSEVKGADGCTYVPALGDNGGNIGITMHNAAIKSWIDNAWDANNSKLAYTSDSYDSFSGYTFAKSQVVGGKQQYKQTVPFYSYPTHWGQGSTSGEAYLLLVVKWKKTKDENGVSVTNASEQPCYYEIPIGKLDTQNNVVSEYIERNHHYQISIDVGTLGSFVQEDPVTLSPSYMVVDWTSGEITAQLTEKRYLVVDETEIEIFNQNEYSIGYASSHPDKTTVKILSVTRDDMSSEIAGTTTFYLGDGVTSINAGEWDDDEKYKLLKGFNVALQSNKIVFTHDLVNEDENSSVNADSYPTSGDFRNVDDYDFAPYYITLEVSMEVDDNTTFSEQITIIQYPQLYAKASQNSDYDNGGGYNDDHNLMVNAYYCKENTENYEYKVNTNQQTFGTAPGLWTSGSTNKNPNMYVVTATAFSSDSPYFIGDPRQLENDTDLINATWNHDNNNYTAQVSIWVNTVDINGATRRLQYYYPTNQERVGNDANDPASYVTGYMVAPKFRVASSYSVTHDTNSKDLAEKRCASYQEDGYPAGRWRLPTYAEAAFMVKLSNEQKIPRLFNAGTNYWCAHGAFKPASDGSVTLYSTGSAKSVRCVYDEWYWGSGQIANKSTFTWGDKQR